MKPSVILEEPTQLHHDISSNADLKEEMKNIEQTLNDEFRDGIQLHNQVQENEISFDGLLIHPE